MLEKKVIEEINQIVNENIPSHLVKKVKDNTDQSFMDKKYKVKKSLENLMKLFPKIENSIKDVYDAGFSSPEINNLRDAMNDIRKIGKHQGLK